MLRFFLTSVLCIASLPIFSMDTDYLIALRHGHGEHLINRVFSSLTKEEGGVDHHLTEQGRDEVAKTAQGLLEKGINRDTVKLVLVSPLRRTQETAQILVDYGVCAPEVLQIDGRIREHRLNNMEGLVKESISGIEHCPHWSDEVQFLEERGGEKFHDFLGRLHSALHSIQETSSLKGHVILVTHGAVVSFISELYGDLSPVQTAEARVFPLPKIDEGTLP